MESPVSALIVGLLQGLLEWLPISSQGNLVIFMISFLGLEPEYALSLSVYLHLGTGLATLVYFREEIFGVLRRDSANNRLLFRFLVIATLTTGIVGLPLFLIARGTSLVGEALLTLTGAALIVTGLVQRGARGERPRTTEPLETKDGIILGVVQGLSALPGLSRSGLTTSVMLFRGYQGVEAFRISFIISVPAVFAAAMGLTVVEGAPPLGPGVLLALVASFLSAYLTIDVLLKLARRVRFWSLCIALGLLALLPQLQFFL
ncbi:MAG: undecaprenyl-diphosphate phosphatase [Candidatus Bathyarchaeota archaeon]|nr:MAG: undecaprenyl-diphosphate phosphatase [Candidatus Bathyarchaeota archaeon]